MQYNKLKRSIDFCFINLLKKYKPSQDKLKKDKKVHRNNKKCLRLKKKINRKLDIKK